MLIDSEKVRETKEHIEVMQAFIDGKEIEFKQDSYEEIWKDCITPIWDFCEYKYRIKPSEPEYVYPIYKRLKTTPEIIVKFTRLDSGIYIGTEAQSIYKQGDVAKYMRPHTSCSWEDYDFTEKKEEEESSEPEYVNTEELFEVIYYCDIMKEFIFVKQLYLDEDLKYLKHHQKNR